MSPPPSSSTSFPCKLAGCNRSFGSALGLSIHQRTCAKKLPERVRDTEYEAAHGNVQSQPADPHPAVAYRRIWEMPQLRKPMDREGPTFLGPPARQPQHTMLFQPADLPQLAENENSRTPTLDSIRTEYHPNSKREPRLDRFEDYRDRPETAPPPAKSFPWKPFQSRTDFEFAELALEAGLTKDQVDSFIKIINRCVGGQDSFNIMSHRDLRATWEAASELVTPFKKDVITVNYKEIDGSADFWHCDLWDWAVDMIRNPLLADKFTWDACRLSKFNGEEFVRFIHEPWTADRFWEVQSQLPDSEGKPFGIILYADQTKLSSFGTQKGYPIIARIANLPSEIRNGKGLGGGRVVGLLPIVKDDERYKNKPAFTDFKRAIWHKSFDKFLECIKQHSKLGVALECGDKLIRLLYPFILILSADYEEQVVMTLIRGLKGLFPCPVCLIPANELDNLDVTWALRSIEVTRQLVANAERKERGAEESLKQQGLRPVRNAFWEIEFSDPFKAVSWDRMHAYAHGLGGKHLWPLLQTYIEELGRDAMHMVDEQARKLPRWRGFNHFDKILHVEFSDATKLEHLVKISLFVMHSILDEEESPHGYLLLRVLRSYLMIDIYASMDVHTTETIAEGRRRLKKYSDLLQLFTLATSGTREKDKNWCFPKNHSHQHTFDDILAKGVTRCYNTKYNENMHGGLKNSFQWRSNFRDVEEQLLRADHWFHVAVYIRSEIELLDAETKRASEEIEGEEVKDLPATQTAMSPFSIANIYLSAAQRPTTITSIAEQHREDPNFSAFYRQLKLFLSSELDSAIVSQHVQPLTEVTEYRFLKVKYESKVTCQMDEDYLRCSPSHYKRPRHDCVLLNTDEGLVFAQLVFLFKIIIADHPYSVALVETFSRERGSAATRKKDSDLGFLRLRKQGLQFFWARSIIRGVPIFPAFDNDNNSIVFDIIDADMVLRVEAILNG